MLVGKVGLAARLAGMLVADASMDARQQTSTAGAALLTIGFMGISSWHFHGYFFK
jgi:hypothetical protein